MTERDDTPPDPHEDRLKRARERLAVQDYDEPPRRNAGGSGKKWWAPGALLASGDPTTRKLTIGAFGLGALLVIGVGGWSLLGHHEHGIAVIGPPSEPVREKPADPGGMELDGAVAPADSPTGAAHLAPAPERPDPVALAARYGAQAGEDAPKPDGAAPEEAAGDAGAEKNAPAAAALPDASQTEPAEADKAAPASAAGAETEQGDQAAAEQPEPAPAPPPPPAHKRAAPLPGPASVTEKEARPPAPPRQDAAKPAGESTGPYGVQLAALDSDAAARKEWDRLTASSPQMFAGRSPVVEKVVHSNAIFYRLRMRGFPNMAAAQAFCVKIRDHGHACNPLRP